MTSSGQRLVDVHDHLRDELKQIHDLVEQVGRGAVAPGEARSAIKEMTVRQNNWSLGAYCASYCRVVTVHHSLEDASVFPHLRAKDPSLGAVLDRLSQEHLVVHELLNDLDSALVRLVDTARDVAAVREALATLSDTLRAHLDYEEQQLVEPLNRYGLT